MMKNRKSNCEREYGIDLLKVIAMVFIVAGHCFFRGGAGLTSGVYTGAKGLTYELVNALIICHVNCFVLCTGWLMCRREPKFRRLVDLWCLMVFYSLSFIVVAKMFFPAVPISRITWLAAICPIGLNPYWFLTQYFLLMFMVPVLNSALVNLGKGQMQKVLLAGGFFLVLYPFVFRRDMFGKLDGFSAFWFAFLYLVAGHIKLNGFLKRLPSWGAMVVLLVCPVFAVLGMHAQNWLSTKLGCTPDAHMFGAYTSPFLLMEAVAMFLIFTRMKIKTVWCVKLLTLISPSVLAVYLIHSNGVFRQIVNWNVRWTEFFADSTAGFSVIVVLGISLLIFSACIVVDLCRRMWLTWCCHLIKCG